MRDASPPLVLTITPGRAGSVFLADVLARGTRGGAEITHERLGPDRTLPRIFFHPFDEARQYELATFPPVAEFLTQVEQTLEAGTAVVEVGMFTSHLVPLLAERFPKQLRVLALFRHPLLTAASHSLRGMYHPWPHWSFFALANITPFDPGMLAPGFRTRWQTMTPFERNLYSWTEYVLLWQRFKKAYSTIPALAVSSEELFADPGRVIRTVADFAGVIGDWPANAARRNELEGKSPRRYGLESNWRERIGLHPELQTAAAFMGYRLDDQRVLEKMKKYEAPRDVGNRLLRNVGYFGVRSYVHRLTSRRFWRYRSRLKMLTRTYPDYSRQMFG